MPGVRRSSRVAGNRPPAHRREPSYPDDASADEDDEMALLEDVRPYTPGPRGEEVEEFARWLDEVSMNLGSKSADRRGRIFKLVNRYYAHAQEQAEKLRERQRLDRLARKGSSGGRDAMEDVAQDVGGMDLSANGGKDDQLKSWTDEAQTWDLLRKVLPLRYRDTPSKPAHRTHAGPRSRKQYWDDFVLSDNLKAERKAVLEWLQSNANAGPDVDELVEQAQKENNPGDAAANGWLHTRSAIKLHKSVNALSRELDPKTSDMADFQYITQLDPDAITRQGRKLETHDDGFERATWVGCYHLLRRGHSIKDIRDWCSERTENWRAAVASAIPMAMQDRDDGPDFDPAAAILWKRTCYALVKHGGVDDFERAYYGMLAGDLSSVLAVGRSWDDYIFAHYNALLRTQFDSYLIDQSGAEKAAMATSLPAFDAVQFMGDSAGLGKRLIQALEGASSAPKLARQEAATVSKTLEGAIIANSLDQYMFQQGKAIAADANKTEKSTTIPADSLHTMSDEADSRYVALADHNQLRLVAHIIIVLYALDNHDSDSEASMGALSSRVVTDENTLVAYIMYLRMAYLEELLPLYCSKLTGIRRYEVLSQNVIHVVDIQVRATLLNLIARVGLDLNTFFRLHPTNFFRQLQETQTGVSVPSGGIKILRDKAPSLRHGRGILSDFMGSDRELPAAQLRVIKAMEWFKLSEGMLFAASDLGVDVYKFLLMHKDLDAARKFVECFRISEVVHKSTGLEIAENSSAETLAELFAAQGYREKNAKGKEIDVASLALIVRNMLEMEALVLALDAIETVGTFADLLNELPSTQRASKEVVSSLGKAIRDAQYNMGLVLDGWMLETNEEDDTIAALREMYIPETILAYIAALQFTGTVLTRDYLLECMDLATIIAAKDSDLAPLFVKTGRMTELVESFASASKALAIYSGDHAGPGSGVAKAGGGTAGAAAGGSKLAKEKGWHRDLWTVRS